MKKNILLRDFVYRTLIQRIVITTVVIALLMIIAISFVEKQNSNEEIQKLAADGASVLNQSIMQYLDGESAEPLQNTLDELSDSRIHYPDGHFVYYEIYDHEAQVVAKFEDNDYLNLEFVKSVLKDITRSTNSKKLPIYKRVKIKGIPHAGIVLPLYDSQHEVQAFILGVYAVSDRAVNNFEKKLRRSFSLVLIIVLLTSALLYPVIMRLTKSLADYSSELLNANLDMLETLGSAIAKRDSDTSAHNYRVTILAVRLAEKLAINPEDIKGLIKGSFLHDVGKIAISDNILLKPGKLDDDEFSVMKTHVDHGVDIVNNSVWLRDAVEVVASHHEKCDGSGYPAGYSLDQIPINARIFAIADVFDALTSKRPYKEPFSFEKTMAILRESKGSHFDPQLLDAFESIAEALYQHLSGREDEGLREEVLKMTQQYFSSGLASLRY